MSRFAKRKGNTCKCATRNFSGQEGGFVELEHFDKHFVKKKRKKKKKQNPEKRGLQGNILEFFLLDTLKIVFWIGKLAQKWTQPGPFFPKSGHYFQFSKRLGETSPLLLIQYTNLPISRTIKDLFWLNYRDPFRGVKKKEGNEWFSFKPEKTKYKHQTKTFLQAIY